MHDRYRHLLLVIVAFLCAVAGVAKHAVALTFTEFPVPCASPGRIAGGRDGALCFPDLSIHVNKIGRIPTEGVATDSRIPTANSSPVIITAGPDEALWFTEYNSNKIGRITTAGVITEFPLPATGSGPFNITTGPDGALWFTEVSGKIGRIRTAAGVNEVPLLAIGTALMEST